MPLPVIVLVAVGAGIALAIGSKKKPAPPGVNFPGGQLPGGINIPPINIPPINIPPINMPGIPPGGVDDHPRVVAGCTIDASFPNGMLVPLQAVLTRTDLDPTQVQALAYTASSVGFPKVGACIARHAAELGAAHGQTGPDAGAPRPSWYPSWAPWPLPLPSLPWATTGGGGGSGTPSPTPPASGWGPAPPILPAGIPWPPPFPPPAGWVPGQGIPGLGIPPWDASGGGAVPGDPSPPHGGIAWPPRPPGLPASIPWPPFGGLNPDNNPIVGSSVETQIRPGDEAAGYAYYYSGHGPIAPHGGPYQQDADMGPAEAAIATLAALNPGLHGQDGTPWTRFTAGSTLYLPAEWVDKRGLPPVPTHIYNAFHGFVPRNDMLPGGLPAPVGTP